MRAARAERRSELHRARDMVGITQEESADAANPYCTDSSLLERAPAGSEPDHLER